MNVTNTTIDKTKQKPNSYITEITFNNNETIGIKQNDIVIFVGPNNAGKSQSLVDIYALCEEEKRPTIIIKKIHVKKCDEKTLNTFLHDNSTIKDNGNYSQYSGYNYSISSYQINDYTNKPTFGSTRNLFVSHLNTETRLSISNPPASIVQSEPKQHPIHYAAFTPEYRKTLTKHFKKAFGCDIIPNILNGRTVPLCMGDNITLDGEYLNEQERQEEYGRRLSTYKQIQQQGDGLRSFTGILLYLGSAENP